MVLSATGHGSIVCQSLKKPSTSGLGIIRLDVLSSMRLLSVT